MKPIKHISLFSGIGGFDLAAEWTGWETIAHCEIDPFCRRVLKYYWPQAQTHEDITKTDFTPYRGRVHVLSGGFPCQGFSLAGKRLGTDDYRYLWPQMLRAIHECRPAFVCGENVTGILSMENKSGVWAEVYPKVENRTIVRYDEIDIYEAIYTRQAKMLVNSICEDLEKIGYTVQTFAVPAAAIGAPHKRERIWFIAYANSDGHQLWQHSEDRPPQGPGQSEGDKWQRIRRNAGRTGQPQNVANAQNKQHEWPENTRHRWPRPADSGSHNNYADAYCSRCEQGNEKMEIGPPKRSYSTCIQQITAKCNSERCSKRINAEQPEGKRLFDKHFFSSENWRNFPSQPPVCSGDDGLSARLDGITFSQLRNNSIRAYGNAVVPNLVHEFYKPINDILTLKTTHL